jgi:hypothetical protein
MATARFIGQVRTQWLRHAGDDREMELLEDFAFIDPSGVQWDAPAGRIVDGASIPRLLWTVTGSPFVGDFRRASVLHDVACQDQRQPHEAVHRMFYDAMKQDGVTEIQAQQFYFAVRVFGPKWEVVTGARRGRRKTARRAGPPQAALSIDELSGVIDAALGERTPPQAATRRRVR